MSYIVLERIYNPPLVTPVDHEDWATTNYQLDRCLHAREVKWIRSLISNDGSRSICEFEAPYADAVREACHESRSDFGSVWHGEIWVTGKGEMPSEGKSLVAVEVTFDPPITPAMCDANKKRAEGCLSELGVYPTYSLVSADGRRSICFFVASSAEDVRSLYRTVGMPFDRIWRAEPIVPT